MPLSSDQAGNHHIYLSRNEIARLSFDATHCLLDINSREAYRFRLAELAQLVIEGAGQVNYVPSYHQQPLQQLFAQLGIERGICVDIGAYDGVNYSNTYPLLKAGWSGLMLECDPDRFASLAHSYRVLPQASLARAKITPANAVSLLQAHGIPTHFDFLSLDIDSYDYYVLEALLDHYRPKAILTEINEAIPPPIKFAVSYQERFSFDPNKRFYGQSLAQLAELCQRKNYVMLDMYYMDVFLLDAALFGGLAPSIEEIYERGLRSRELPAYYANYPFDVPTVLQAPPEQALELIREGYREFEGSFICRL